MVLNQAFEGGAWLGGRKAKFGGPSTYVRGPRHQDHAKMNARILENAMAVQRLLVAFVPKHNSNGIS